ncbi:MAG: alpha-ketoglutarate-dependent dioxygenase AlkB [Planctomycetes bacterium]|nr:alpha-ketoglutarate-dependent dioxygenase AlkB [Planctomycetota bacterium]
MKQHAELHDGGTLDYDDAFFDRAEADALFARLRDDTPWRQERSRLGPFPRLTAWYADPGLTYSYSGVTHEALAWTATLLAIRRRVEAAAMTPFNSVLLNYYRDGQDSIGYHADNESELGKNPVIASISLGAVRQFVLKHGATGDKLHFDLASGSLLVMGGTCQHHWVHMVPKTKQFVDGRINLTFRNLIGQAV